MRMEPFTFTITNNVLNQLVTLSCYSKKCQHIIINMLNLNPFAYLNFEMQFLSHNMFSFLK